MKGNMGGPSSVKFTTRMKENPGHCSLKLPHPWREGAQTEVSFFSILLLIMPGIEAILIFYYFEVYLTRRDKLNIFRDMS